MTTMELRSSVLQDIASLLGNDEAMLKLQKYIHHLKNELHIDTTGMNDFKKTPKKDLQDALQEVKEAEIL